MQRGSAILHAEMDCSENAGPEDYLRERGVELTIADDPECIALMEQFIQDHFQLWNEDIGEPD